MNKSLNSEGVLKRLTFYVLRTRNYVNPDEMDCKSIDFLKT